MGIRPFGVDLKKRVMSLADVKKKEQLHGENEITEVLEIGNNLGRNDAVIIAIIAMQVPRHEHQRSCLTR